MAEQVEIDIVGKDMLSGTVNSIKGSFTELNSAIMIGEKVLGYLAKAYDKTVGAAQTYDQQVYELMLKTGGTADETSRLIQVIDDTGIEYGVLETAMKIAVKNGIDPNIESLAKLSDEYLALNDPVEQGQLLMKKFGRSGLDMVRAMELGGDELRKMNSEMSGGLILTQENIDASEDYRKSLDSLKDSYQGLAVSAGNDLIPALVRISEQMQKNIVDYDEFKDKNNELSEFINYPLSTMLKWTLGIADNSSEIDTATEGYIQMARGIEGATKKTEEDTEAQAENAKMREETIKLISNMNSAQLSATNSMQSNADSFNQKYQQVNADMNLSDDERKAKLAELTAEHDKDTKKIILGMLEQRLAQGGLTTEELNYLLQKGQAWGIYSDTVVSEAKAAMAEVDALANKINDIPASRTFTLTVAQQGTISDFYSSMNMGGRGASGKATGGSVTAGTPYIVGERGQELFVPNQSGTIVPNNKLSGAGGANININIVTPALIGSDGAARDALLPILRAGVRQLQSEGLLPL